MIEDPFEPAVEDAVFDPDDDGPVLAMDPALKEGLEAIMPTLFHLRLGNVREETMSTWRRIAARYVEKFDGPARIAVWLAEASYDQLDAGLDEIARIAPTRRWDDLVLPVPFVGPLTDPSAGLVADSEADASEDDSDAEEDDTGHDVDTVLMENLGEFIPFFLDLRLAHERGKTMEWRRGMVSTYVAMFGGPSWIEEWAKAASYDQLETGMHAVRAMLPHPRWDDLVLEPPFVGPPTRSAAAYDVSKE